MKAALVSLFVGALVLAVLGRDAAEGHAQAEPAPDPASLSRVIVLFDTPPGDAPGARSAQVAQRSSVAAIVDGARLTRAAGYTDYRTLLNGVALSVTPDEADALSQLPGVRVYPDREIHVDLAQTVPLIGANTAWTFGGGTTGENMRIAIIDSGIDYTHPDLGGCFGPGCKVVGGYDFVNNDPDPMDDHGHGTHVAAIAAGNGALKGVAPAAKLYAYRVVGAGGLGSTSDAIKALERAVDPDSNPLTADKPHVINLSVNSAGDPDDPFTQAVEAVSAQNIVVVVSAGNDGPGLGTIGSPGGALSAITVGASSKQDTMATFSGQGPVTWPGGSRLKPDVVAPGMAVCAAKSQVLAIQAFTCNGDSTHIELFGTSMAAPHVAGAAALLRQAHPNWTPEQVKASLRMTAKDLGLDYTLQGYGRIRVDQAIALPHDPLVARIETSGRFGGPTDIIGTVGGTGFAQWKLSIGAGTRPTSFNDLTSGSTPLDHGVLMSGLNPDLFADGTHTLRLQVENANGVVTEDRALFIVDNIELQSPQSYDVVPRGTSVFVSGTVLGGGAFQSYVVEWGQGASPASWSTSGMSMLNGGTVPVQDGILAAWDTGALPPGDVFSIRLRALYSWGQSSTISRSIRVSQALQPGWPQRRPWDVAEGLPGLAAAPASGTIGVQATSPLDQYHWAGFYEPLVVDLDGDGQKEIAVFHAGEHPQLIVYTPNGNIRWTRNIGNEEILGPLASAPIAADLTGDGLPEIILHGSSKLVPGAPSRLYAFRADGTNAPGFPVVIAGDSRATLAAADLDRDGTNEIIVQGNANTPRTMVIVRNNGTVAAQWNLFAKVWTRVGAREPSPAVGNFDADPDLEIVSVGPAPAQGQKDDIGVVLIYNRDGSVVQGWPKFLEAFVWGSPAVGDLNKDGLDDIVFGVESRAGNVAQGGVHALNRFGQELPGWPVQLGKSFLSAPALGDVNGDGNLEVAITKHGDQTYLFSANGSLMPGWPKSHPCCAEASTILADVSGDGAPDILTTASNHNEGGGIFAWHANGDPVAGFPLPVEADAEGPVTVTDVDGDGLINLVASSDFDYDFDTLRYKLRSSVYVFELPAAATTGPWPQFQHDTARTGRLGAPITPTPDADCDQVITANDALLVLRAITNMAGQPPCGGDANGDGGLSLLDAVLIQLMASNLHGR